MRLFVAVEIGPVAERAAALAGELRQCAARLAPLARITWIPADRLHLTIRFIGSVDAERAGAIQAAMSPPLDTASFELGFAGVGAFPSSGRPQVLWAGVSAGEPGLRRLEEEVTARLVPLGIPAERRPFRPHLTLARVREASGLRGAALFAGIEQASLGTTHCEAITLYESRLSPAGPTYVPLRRTPLRQGDRS